MLLKTKDRVQKLEKQSRNVYENTASYVRKSECY